MKEKEFKESILDYALGKLTNEKRVQFEQFLLENKQYQDEVNQFKAIYQVTVTSFIPEPSIEMDDNFHAFLANEIDANKASRSSYINFKKILSVNHLFEKLVYATMILLLGAFIGQSFMSDRSSFQDQYVALQKESAEVEAVRSQLVMALINQPSANKRLQGINESEKLDQVTEVVITALFKTLNNDQNINVRLAAIGSLSKYTQNPLVREGLVNSLAEQNSPMVQIALAELMVTIQEKSSVESMQKMLEQPGLNDAAKQKLKQSINILL